MASLSADHLEERRTVLNEMLQRREGDLTARAHALVRTSLLTERIRFGELALFDSEFPESWRLAADVLHSSELQAQLRLAQGCRHMASGEVELGSGIANSALQVMSQLTPARGAAQFTIDCSVMLVTGTLADHADTLAARFAQPEHPSLPHLLAPAAALGFARRGDAERAREIASRWFLAPPRSWTWFQAIAYWAQVATEIAVPDPEWLHAQLARHSGELAIVGSGADCGGAVDSLLAGLALRLGRPAEAQERARTGLALETKVGSPTWITRTEKLIAQIGRT